VPGGRVELPTNPESVRGCSTAANSRWRGRDSSSVSVLARFSAPLPTLLLVFLLLSQASFRDALSLLCDRGDVGRSARPDQRTKCQGGESNSRPRAHESPALPLSYPGVKAGKLNLIPLSVNVREHAIGFGLFIRVER
jgi:hypothetical protein